MFQIQIKLPPEGGSLSGAAAAALHTSPTNIQAVKVLKRSIDARHTPQWIYTLAVSVKEKSGITAKSYTPPVPFHIPKVHSRVRPVVVGFGPAGLFGALVLARAGLRPIVLERGKDVETRKKDLQRFFSTGNLSPASNVQFGEGGAGAFSDGKIGTGIKSPLLHFITDTLLLHGAPAEIAYEAHPHIGSDRLPQVVKSIREEIIRQGGEVHFDTQLTDLHCKGNAICAAVTSHAVYPTSAILLAIGHSARDTFAVLRQKNVTLLAKPFSVGARIEHPRSVIDHALYGSAAAHLPAAEYRLVAHLPSGRSLYSFCMCPGGYVIPAASEIGGVVTNGYSLHARDGENSNCALLVGITPDDFGHDPFDGVQLQRQIEEAAFRIAGNYLAPCQRVEDFLQNRPSSAFGSVHPTYARGVVPGNIADCLPDFVADTMRQGLPLFAKKIKPFAMPDALLTAPETRSSSPLRICRNAQYESNLAGLFPAGEGSGYAGGIMSAAADGMMAALSIIDRISASV
ncbi:MAG: hypothetical protein PUB07_01275 [Clostridia bacterium]|nr:hypothetical protein [Clostridia bacterium]